jgi:Arc/MetJ-type ribon-helix-helix transcriptional regulator
MDIVLTPDQEVLVRHAIETGRFRRQEDAVKEALALWAERERNRAAFLASLDEADASAARGEGRVVTSESMHDLVEEVHQRGLDRIAPDKPSRA